VADIFISYSQSDRKRVARVVRALEAEGFEVWWDKGVLAGTQWRKELDAQLEQARAIVPVWTASSITSDWVIEEAAFGKRKGLLCPARIEAVEPPIGFTTIQVADLAGWRGSRRNEAWRHFVSALHQLVHGTDNGAKLPTRQRWPLRLGLAAALAALCLAALWLVPRWTGLPLADSFRGTAEQRDAWRTARAGGDCRAIAQFAALNAESPFAAAARLSAASPQTVVSQGWASKRETPPVFGVSSTDTSRDAACTSARAAARRSAGESCALFAKAADKVRNLSSQLAGETCTCKEAAGHWQCTVDTKAECSWQVRDTVTREVCT